MTSEDYPTRKVFRCATVPNPPTMDMWYGPEQGTGTMRSYTPPYPPTVPPYTYTVIDPPPCKILRVPRTRTDTNWRSVDEDSARGESYQDRYLQLSANIADRYPNPGRPRERMGRIGGSWRHIREVLGYTGSQVCFVDGLVSLYDTDNKAAGLHKGAQWRARLTGPTGYSANMSQDMGCRKPAGVPLTPANRPKLTAGFKAKTPMNTFKTKGFYTLQY